MRGVRRFWVVPAAALVLAGCSEDGPVAPPDSGGAGAVEYLSCQVDLTGSDLSCTSDGPSLDGGALGAIIGGQGTYVQLTSSNVGYDSGSEVFSANVTIKNLSNQVLGSADGSSHDAAGVRIFFVGAPTTTGGSGAVTVANSDGKGDFSGTGQDYFQYSQPLASGQTSLARSWEWNVPSTVTSFNFEVGVSAEVRDEPTLEPGLNFLANRVAADTMHSCAIDLDGQAWCWGRAGNGRLGQGAALAENLSTAQRVVQDGLHFVSISAGLNFTCALDISGDAYCWGYGEAGRLGNGFSGGTNYSTPQAVIGGKKFVQITTGRRFACALSTEQDVYCWGGNQETYSPLGDGTDIDRSEPHPIASSEKFTWINAGKYHACGITTGGDTYCWGAGSPGRLGNGAEENVKEPVLVQGGHRFVTVTGGNNHSCGLTAEGEAWCWGSNGNGKRGTVDEEGVAAESSSVPVRISSDLRFVSLQVGSHHTCAITTDRKTYCWGSQARGKVGNGTTGSGNVLLPVEVVGGHEFVELGIGIDHSCAMTAAGETYCWGRGDNGQIGNGLEEHVGTPAKVQFPGPAI